MNRGYKYSKNTMPSKTQQTFSNYKVQKSHENLKSNDNLLSNFKIRFFIKKISGDTIRAG